MNFAYSGGTPQQLRWIQDALTDCTYPLSAIGVNVTFQFAQPLPISTDIGHAHSYMVTQQVAPGDFTISIATWADDPTNPNNLGLPNPAQDIYDFFKQSIVHELGHVVHFTLINSPLLQQQAASLFWTPDITGGPGRRYGSLPDWSATVWVDNVMEGIAEVFKCVFYSQRLIFLDRTDWHIDQTPFNELIQLLTPPATAGVVDDFTATIDPFIAAGNGFTSGGVLDVPGDGITTTLSLYDPTQLSSTVDVAQSLKVDAFGALGLSELLMENLAYPAGTPFAQATMFYTPNGAVTAQVPSIVNGTIGLSIVVNPDGVTDVDVMDGAAGIITANVSGSSAGANAAIIVPSVTFPFWLRLVASTTGAAAEIWETDPQHGGSPSHQVSVTFAITDGQVLAETAILLNTTTDGIFDDWRFGNPNPAVAIVAPYPFGAPQGAIALGNSGRGSIVVGANG